MAGITVKIYDGTNPTALIATLTESKDRNWLDQLTDTGSGGFRLHADDAIFDTQPDVLAYGNIVRFFLNDVERFASVIETRELSPASPEEKAGLWWNVDGRGVLSLLADAIVYPELVADAEFGATLTGVTTRQRQFDWTAIQYDDSSWIAATQLNAAGSGDPIADWLGAPANWPDTSSYWIWSRDPDVNDDMPVGFSYFRQSFTVDPEFDGNECKFYAACDNRGIVYLDGEVILEPETWTESVSVVKRLSAGVHQVAIVGENFFSTTLGSGGPAGVLFVGYVLDDSSNISDGLIQTNSAWKALDYPAAVPGMSIGTILRILLEEAQSRGALEDVSWTFTDLQDSAGASWTAGSLIGSTYTLDVALDIGMNYLDVARTFMEQWIDARMTPSLLFNVYNKGTYGTDLSASISLLVGTDFEDLNEKGEEHTTNSVLVRDTTGVLSLQEDAGSLASRKRKEVYLEFALAPTEERAQQMASEIIVEFGEPTIMVTGTIDIDAGVYTDFGVADTIKLPDTHGAQVAATVTSIAVSEDEVGHPIYVIEAMMFDENL